MSAQHGYICPAFQSGDLVSTTTLCSVVTEPQWAGDLGLINDKKSYYLHAGTVGMVLEVFKDPALSYPIVFCWLKRKNTVSLVPIWKLSNDPNNLERNRLNFDFLVHFPA